MRPARLTGEHIWGHWIGEELKKLGAARMRLSRQPLDDPTTFTWESPRV